MTDSALEIVPVAASRLALTFNSEVKLGDLLTSVSVLVAAFTFTYTLMKDRRARRREQADAVRTAAAETLARLDRYAGLPLMLYDDVQGLLVESTEELARTKDVGQARDHLWKGLTAAWHEILVAQRMEEIELAHVRLYGHRPEVYEDIVGARAMLDRTVAECFQNMLEQAQARVLYVGPVDDRYEPAVLGDQLRDVVAGYRKEASGGTNAALRPVRQRLHALIAASDTTVLNRHKASPDHRAVRNTATYDGGCH